MDPSGKRCQFTTSPQNNSPWRCCYEGASQENPDRQKRILDKSQWTTKFASVGKTSSPRCFLDLHYSSWCDNSNVGDMLEAV